MFPGGEVADQAEVVDSMYRLWSQGCVGGTNRQRPRVPPQPRLLSHPPRVGGVTQTTSDLHLPLPEGGGRACGEIDVLLVVRFRRCAK